MLTKAACGVSKVSTIFSEEVAFDSALTRVNFIRFFYIYIIGQLIKTRF